MESWFRNRNSRRFFRFDMEAQILIRPKNHSATPIHSNGINYFPKYVHDKYQNLTAKSLQNLSKVIEHKEVIVDVMQQVFDASDYFMEVLATLSSGNDFIQREDLIKDRRKFLRGFDLSGLEHSPRTMDIFVGLHNKYVFMISKLLLSVENSNKFKVHYVDIRKEFEIDRYLHQFQREKFRDIPLPQAILGLIQLTDFIYGIFDDFLQDHRGDIDPNFWQSYKINVSACGLALRMKKRLNKNDELVVFIKIGDTILGFDGRLINFRDIKDGYETVSIDFQFPTSKNQLRLNSLIQISELEDCIETDILIPY